MPMSGWNTCEALRNKAGFGHGARKHKMALVPPMAGNFVVLQWLHVEGSGICQKVAAASLASTRKLSECRIN